MTKRAVQYETLLRAVNPLLINTINLIGVKEACYNHTKTGMIKLLPATYTNFVLHCCNMCSEAKGSEEELKNLESSLPEIPTTCCMSGCANCVWIQYAEEMSKFYDDGGEKARDVILSKVTDPNTRAFLMMELKNLTDKPS